MSEWQTFPQCAHCKRPMSKHIELAIYYCWNVHCEEFDRPKFFNPCLSPDGIESNVKEIA